MKQLHKKSNTVGVQSSDIFAKLDHFKYMYICLMYDPKITKQPSLVLYFFKYVCVFFKICVFFAFVFQQVGTSTGPKSELYLVGRILNQFGIQTFTVFLTVGFLVIGACLSSWLPTQHSSGYVICFLIQWNAKIRTSMDFEQAPLVRKQF